MSILQREHFTARVFYSASILQQEHVRNLLNSDVCVLVHSGCVAVGRARCVEEELEQVVAQTGQLCVTGVFGPYSTYSGVSRKASAAPLPAIRLCPGTHDTISRHP